MRIGLALEAVSLVYIGSNQIQGYAVGSASHIYYTFGAVIKKLDGSRSAAFTLGSASLRFFSIVLLLLLLFGINRENIQIIYT